MTPTNQHQQVIWYLMNMTNFCLADVIADSMFFKFQTRLSEIEGRWGIIATRERRKFTNKFGKKSSYNIYNTKVSQDKLKTIFDFCK